MAYLQRHNPSHFLLSSSPLLFPYLPVPFSFSALQPPSSINPPDTVSLPVPFSLPPAAHPVDFVMLAGTLLFFLHPALLRWR